MQPSNPAHAARLGFLALALAGLELPSLAQDRAAPLEKLAVPTLVITGDEDRVYPPELAERMARRIPGAKLVVLEDCGHLSNLEQPERFNEVLLEFLNENSGSDPN